VVAVLPAYHHLKKAIFELTKTAAFTAKMFKIKYVITKVNARNFYMNRNRNFYQFLIENSLKGVSNAIMFERGVVMPDSELRIMQNILEHANFSQGILCTTRSSFDLEQLSQIFMR